MKVNSTNTVNYPSRLLKIETRQQIKQLSVFDDSNQLKPDIASEINSSIHRILKLNENGKDEYSIEFPQEIEERLDTQIRDKIAKQLTGNEVRLLTAVLILAQLSQSRNELTYMENINRASFTIELSTLYKFMGIRSSGQAQRTQVKASFQKLHHREFLIPITKYNPTKGMGHGFEIRRLLEIHSFLSFENGSKTIKVSVDSSFLNLPSNKPSTYFSLPIDINKKLRAISTGRPNVGVELFIKCLYQARHCTSENKVEYSYNRLVEIMRLDKYKRSNNYKRIKPTINKGMDMAKKLGLVSKVTEELTKFGEIKFVIEFAEEESSMI
ncbi:hypothetical protein [Chondrinema litorale]|uniref:hypothetical protein n=1 Tax=Chondrinema litorale TaxID=2994555 RepID=UPI002542CF16|nr:hypothetical protein [Chondrinema litorale]UZR97812.1 hypothetical protein OQ292_27780 [Chondrinema litorale]